jgi:hypothetical protein
VTTAIGMGNGRRDIGLVVTTRMLTTEPIVQVLRPIAELAQGLSRIRPTLQVLKVRNGAVAAVYSKGTYDRRIGWIADTGNARARSRSRRERRYRYRRATAKLAPRLQTGVNSPIDSSFPTRLVLHSHWSVTSWASPLRSLVPPPLNTRADREITES